MQFELTRTTSKFGVFNPREEKNKGNAFDLPFSVTVPCEILSMLAPNVNADGEDDTIVEELFSEEGHVSRPALNPLIINRKPEGATVTIWDQEDFGDPLTMLACNLKSLKAELQTPNQVVLTGLIQHSQYDNNELIRINALMNKSFDLAIEIEQSDLFDKDPEAESEEQDSDSK